MSEHVLADTYGVFTDDCVILQSEDRLQVIPGVARGDDQVRAFEQRPVREPSRFRSPKLGGFDDSPIMNRSNEQRLPPRRVG